MPSAAAPGCAVARGGHDLKSRSVQWFKISGPCSFPRGITLLPGASAVVSAGRRGTSSRVSRGQSLRRDRTIADGCSFRQPLFSLTVRPGVDRACCSQDAAHLQGPKWRAQHLRLRHARHIKVPIALEELGARVTGCMECDVHKGEQKTPDFAVEIPMPRYLCWSIR